jgi:hypothetical protein
MKTIIKPLTLILFLLCVVNVCSFAAIDFTVGEKTIRQANNPVIHTPTDASQCAGGSEIQNSTFMKGVWIAAGLIPGVMWVAAGRQIIKTIREEKGWRCYEALCDSYLMPKWDLDENGIRNMYYVMCADPVAKCYLYPETNMLQDKRCNTPNCYHLAQSLRQGP